MGSKPTLPIFPGKSESSDPLERSKLNPTTSSDSSEDEEEQKGHPILKRLKAEFASSSTPDPHSLVSSILLRTQSKTMDKFIKEPLPTQLDQLLSALSPTPETLRAIIRLVLDFQIALDPIYPFCKLRMYGSSFTNPDRDVSFLELFVEIPDHSGSFQHFEVKLISNEIMNVLSRPRYQEFVHYSDIPKIKIVRRGKLDKVHLIATSTGEFGTTQIDMIFNGIPRVHLDQLVLFYIGLHPAIKPLLKLIKLWAKCHGFVGDSAKMSDECLTWMILSYAGSKEIIPSLDKMKKLVKNKQNDTKVEGWNVTYNTNHSTILSAYPPSISPTAEVGPALMMDLVKGFFDFYSKFDPQNYMICTNTFEVIAKSSFEGNKTPDPKLEYGALIYHSWLRNKPMDQPVTFPLSALFWIQDPFVLNRNLGAISKKELLFHLQQACREGSKILECGATNTNFLDILLPIPAPTCRSIELGTKILLEHYIASRFELQSILNEVYSCVTDNSITTTSLDSTLLVGLRMKPITDFIRKFALSMNQMNVVRLHGSWSLLQYMKSLWVSFVQDFLSTFFETCFNTQVVNKAQRTRDVPQPRQIKSGKYLKTESGFDYEKHFGEKEPSKSLKMQDGLMQALRSKVDELEEQRTSVNYSIIKCSCSTPVVYDQNERDTAIAKVKQAIVKVQGELERKQQRKMHSWEVHEKVTELMLRQNNKSHPSALEFTICVKLDASLGEELPTLSLVFQQKKQDQIGERKAISVLAAAVSQTLPEYLLRRLTSWLACESVN